MIAGAGRIAGRSNTGWRAYFGGNGDPGGMVSTVVWRRDERHGEKIRKAKLERELLVLKGS